MVQNSYGTLWRGGGLAFSYYLQLYLMRHQKWQGCLLGRSIRYLSGRMEPRCQMGTLEVQSRVRGEDSVFHHGESSGWIVSNPSFMYMNMFLSVQIRR